MINTRYICLYDFETGSTNGDTTQPLEVAAVMINPRKLEVIEDSLFHSYIKPWPEEIRIAKGIDAIQDEALKVNNIKLEMLENAPTEDIVIGNLAEWTYQYNIKRDNWTAPIQAHFNGANFDMKIVNRLCKSYGYWNDKRNQNKIFNPVEFIDLARITFLFNENNEVEANSLNAVREWLGISTANAHQATQDVLDSAQILCRFMRLIRGWSAKTEFRW